MIDSIIRFFVFDTKSDKKLRAEYAEQLALHQKLKNEVREAKIELSRGAIILREAEIKTLFAAMGREYTTEDAAPYFDFDAQQFDFVKQIKNLSIH